MKKILKKIGILLAVIVVLAGAVPINQVEGKSIAVSDYAQWYLPFDSGQVWYVCQGYYGTISHWYNTKFSYGLDLTTDRNGMGTNGCAGTGATNIGKNIRAIASGMATKIKNSYGYYDMVQIKLSNGELIQIGHMVYNSAFWGTAATKTVYQDQVLGTVRNSGYPHIHIHYLNYAFGNRLINASGLYASGSSANQLRGRALCRGVCSDADDNRTISSGQTLSGTINPASDNDTYYFDASSGQKATIAMRNSGSSLDSYLLLYKPDGSQLTYDDDSGGNRDSLINSVSLPASGRYRIIAWSYNNGSAGGYTLSLTLSNPPITCSGQYKAEYYNNRYGSGNPTFTRCENWPISQNWGNGGPGNGVGNDNFFVRWTGIFSFESATYTFTATADDGIRLYVDNGLQIDAWRDQGPTTYKKDVALSAGNHTIKVEYYENGGGATAQASWQKKIVATYGSAWVSQSSYPTVITGGYADLWVTFRNTGNTTWYNTFSPNRTLLGTLNPTTGAIDYPSPFVCSPGWVGNNRPAILSEASVTPGNTGTFRFRICVPSNMSPTTYRIAVAPLVENVSWMKPSTFVYWDVKVNSSSTGNLARGKSAFSGPIQGSLYGPYFANDGSTSTRWSSRDGGYQNWYTDLGSSQSFNQVIINWETAYAKKYAIVFSNDNSTWYFNGSYEYISSAGTKTHNIGSRNYRYVGVRMYENAGNYGNYSMWEIEVYNR
ncbi:MAG: PA14 domain-containing protein [Chloroflexota bacterium]